MSDDSADRPSSTSPRAGEAPAGSAPPVGRGSRPATPLPRYRYEIAELETETGVPSRTIRYYISRGLLAPAYGRGPSATYDLSHLLRLRLITRYKDEHRGLTEIRDRLGGMSDEDVEAALGIQIEPRVAAWRRIMLHPAIELHVRTEPGDATADFVEAVDLIVQLAQPVIDQLEQGPGTAPGGRRGP